MTKLTCGLVDGPVDGLDAVCDGLDGDGVISSGLQVRQREVSVVDGHAAAVPIERLQLVVRHLERKNDIHVKQTNSKLLRLTMSANIFAKSFYN